MKVDDIVSLSDKQGSRITAWVVECNKGPDGIQVLIETHATGYRGLIDADKVHVLPIGAEVDEPQPAQPAEVAPGALVPINELPITYSTLQMLYMTPTVPSRYKNSITGVQDMMAAAQYGAELGILPYESIYNIYLVNGQASISGKTMSALIHRAGHMLKMKFKAESVLLTCFRRDPYTHELVEVGVIEYGKKDADLAGMSGNDEDDEDADDNKDTYAKFPRIMWSWRAVSFAARLFYADVLSGIGYTPDELGIEAPVEAIPVDEIHVDWSNEAIMDNATADIMEAMPGDGEIIYDNEATTYGA